MFADKFEVIKLNDTDFLEFANEFDDLSLEKVSFSFSFIGNTVPKYPKEGPLYFEHLAQISKGSNKLGILKMDVDNLGQIFSSGFDQLLDNSNSEEFISGMSISRMSTLSSQLDLFFSGFVNDIASNYVVYSDIPIILMGKAMELATNTTLDHLVHDLMLNPLSLCHTGYRIINSNDSGEDRGKSVHIPPTEYDHIYRKKRVWGQVHDENAWTMGGIAAHAGIFSTAEDLCRFMMAFASWRKEDGMLSKKTALEMSSLQVEEEGDRRGLIWQLSGSAPESYTSGLSQFAYGHSGFTGCFAWNDPVTGLSIVLLSNDVYNGRENRKLAAFRKEIIQYIIDS